MCVCGQLSSEKSDFKLSGHFQIRESGYIHIRIVHTVFHIQNNIYFSSVSLYLNLLRTYMYIHNYVFCLGLFCLNSHFFLSCAFFP